eukprot:CAMPEP_0115487932 /NCGR_PEP_ID=MMETSP0271-20121206/61209_1 /TAXON_ID=71861 /ORGANISM="Scrippsiella trochoidea, Strain CCMP3099" /LENGTH=77 /DNA_ID=CAMNT_0002915995 /DNA_START=38 /DNA_END=271 /DNA_ORIENTATION=+
MAELYKPSQTMEGWSQNWNKKCASLEISSSTQQGPACVLLTPRIELRVTLPWPCGGAVPAMSVHKAQAADARKNSLQ